jgi:putative SOS response-associated peptidase YedK
MRGPNFPPRFNVAPTQPIPVVTAEPRSGGAGHFQLMRWGRLAGFVKNPKDYPLIFNARAEGVDGETATALLKPAADSAVELMPIGAGVNHYVNDNPSLQEPVGEPIRRQIPDRRA